MGPPRDLVGAPRDLAGVPCGRALRPWRCGHLPPSSRGTPTRSRGGALGPWPRGGAWRLRPRDDPPNSRRDARIPDDLGPRCSSSGSTSIHWRGVTWRGVTWRGVAWLDVTCPRSAAGRRGRWASSAASSTVCSAARGVLAVAYSAAGSAVCAAARAGGRRGGCATVGMELGAEGLGAAVGATEATPSMRSAASCSGRGSRQLTKRTWGLGLSRGGSSGPSQRVMERTWLLVVGVAAAT